MTSRSGRPNPTHAEVLAALSVAIDLGLGQPAEHMLRAALIATRIADRLGLDRGQRDGMYYTTLVMWIGCHADSHEYARWFGDDIAVRHDSYLVDWTGLPYLRFVLGNVARGEPLLQRLKVMSALFVNARGQLSRLIHSHCMSAALLAERIGLGTDVQQALPFAFERYDGGGLPKGVRGEAIPILMRVAQLADMVEVHHRTYGADAAVDMALRRRGGQFDPRVVDMFVEQPRRSWPARRPVTSGRQHCAKHPTGTKARRGVAGLAVDGAGRLRRSEGAHSPSVIRARPQHWPPRPPRSSVWTRRRSRSSVAPAMSTTWAASGFRIASGPRPKH